MNDFDKLIRYCIKIGEHGWAKDLLDIDSDSMIDDFNDLECNLIDSNLLDYHSALKQKLMQS